MNTPPKVLYFILVCASVFGCSETSKVELSESEGSEGGREQKSHETPVTLITQPNVERVDGISLLNDDEDDRTQLKSSVPQKWLDEQTQHVKEQFSKNAFVIGDTGQQNGVWGIIDESDKFLTWPGAPTASPYTGSGQVIESDAFSFGDKRVSF